MAEVTYYYNSRSTGNWADPDNMIDGDTGTSASTASDGTTEELNGNTCPGDDLGTIIKVEIRCYGHGDGDDRIGLWAIYEITMPATPSWSAYVDVTTSIPTWALIALSNLDVEYDKSGKGNPMYCARVEIRVTYTEADGYYHGLKVQSVGELALCDVGSHPLRMRKGGTTYGIELVDTTNGNASAIRIKTSAGIKAIRKYT